MLVLVVVVVVAVVVALLVGEAALGDSSSVSRIARSGVVGVIGEDGSVKVMVNSMCFLCGFRSGWFVVVIDVCCRCRQWL